MFGSCRMCYSPTDKWQDFCNECATTDAPLQRERRAPRPYLVRGGKTESSSTKEQRSRSRKRKRTSAQALTLVKPPSAPTPDA